MTPRITPCIWCNQNAEEVVAFYCSIFPNAAITSVFRYDDDGVSTDAPVLLIEFDLGGQSFQALNGGAEFPHSGAISLSIDCADQAEVDYYSEKLIDGGSQIDCGWVIDRFGVHWQVVPRRLVELLHDPDPVRVGRVMQSMLTMQKLDVAELEAAYGA